MADGGLGRVRGVRLLELQRIDADNGSLIIAQQTEHLPFAAARVFTVLRVPPGEMRGTHAHRHCEQFLICMAGSVRARVDDGAHRAEVLLDRPSLGLYMPPLTWGAQFDYSEDAVLMVLASDPYDAADYIEDYDEFTALATARLR